MTDKIKEFIKKLFNVIKQPEMSVLPGQLAFFSVLSLVPLLMLVATIGANLSLSINSDMLNSIPIEVAELIRPFIASTVHVKAIIFYVTAFLLASNGLDSIILTSNHLYKIEDKGYFKRRIKAIFMTVVMLWLFIFILLVPVFGDLILSVLMRVLPNAVFNTLQIVYFILKYPITLLIMFITINLLYKMAPDKKIKTSSIGAIFTTLGWIISTEIYSFFTTRIISYNIIFGSISNILILLIWVYILSYIFVIGIALNKANEEA